MAQLRDIPLNALRAVETVARLGTLRAAATALGVTQGAVSQHLRRAEDRLGAQLFTRGPQGLILTELGEAVVTDLSRGFALLEQAVITASRRDESALTVSVAPVFASKWLVWRMNDFAQAHPDLTLRIEASMSLISPRMGGADVAIRVGPGGWRDVYARKLADMLVFPVCSPALAERVASAEDLRALPVLHDLHAADLWPDWWREHAGGGAPPARTGPAYSDAALCLDAAIAGQGVLMAWPTLAGDALARGQLVRPVEGILSSGNAYWLITQGPRMTPDIRAFFDWVQAELGRSYAALDLDLGAV
ncbi:LysR substrate-binding domain-containing protein [Pontivivens nitratireducens]|uniref:LysR substrate-binding domain-containing protein n=1 Tax=Pontivivens nitratireducens TaxID=2758038 RepID=UPI00163AC780|nr:LysR substrate-binding domain-containing protein [Pontibrevibacter nitratireducens]